MAKQPADAGASPCTCASHTAPPDSSTNASPATTDALAATPAIAPAAPAAASPRLSTTEATASRVLASLTHTSTLPRPCRRFPLSLTAVLQPPALSADPGMPDAASTGSSEHSAGSLLAAEGVAAATALTSPRSPEGGPVSEGDPHADVPAPAPQPEPVPESATSAVHDAVIASLSAPLTAAAPVSSAARLSRFAAGPVHLPVATTTTTPALAASPLPLGGSKATYLAEVRETAFVAAPPVFSLSKRLAALKVRLAQQRPAVRTVASAPDPALAPAPAPLGAATADAGRAKIVGAATAVGADEW